MGDYDELEGHDPAAKEAIDAGKAKKESKAEPDVKPSKSDS